MRVIGDSHRRRGGYAARSDRAGDQVVVLGLVQADAAELDRHVVLEALQHHLKDTCRVLPFADRAGDFLQEVETAQLRLRAFKHMVEAIREQAQLMAVRRRGAYGIIAPARHGFGGLREREYRFRDLTLQTARYEIREQKARGDYRGGNPTKKAQPVEKCAKIRFQE